MSLQNQQQMHLFLMELLGKYTTFFFFFFTHKQNESKYQK